MVEQQWAFDEIFEIERRLRTGRLEVQILALNQIPDLLTRVKSLPLAVSTIFLRLADHFCTSSHEIRILVTRTVEMCMEYTGMAQPHSEEIVRRLGIVWESNDVSGRALVVRFYGLLADCLAEKGEAVYRVQQSLLSIHEEEYEAAAIAALQLAQRNTNIVVAVVADASLHLLQRIGPFSFLRPKLLDLLSKPLIGRRYHPLQEIIFTTLEKLILVDGEFDEVVIEAMSKIALRSEILMERFRQIFGNLTTQKYQKVISRAYLLPDCER